MYNLAAFFNILFFRTWTLPVSLIENSCQAGLWCAAADDAKAQEGQLQLFQQLPLSETRPLGAVSPLGLCGWSRPQLLSQLQLPALLCSCHWYPLMKGDVSETAVLGTLWVQLSHHQLLLLSKLRQLAVPRRWRAAAAGQPWAGWAGSEFSLGFRAGFHSRAGHSLSGRKCHGEETGLMSLETKVKECWSYKVIF